MNSSLLFLVVSLGLILAVLLIGAGGIVSVSPGDRNGFLPDALMLSGFFVFVATVAGFLWVMWRSGRRRRAPGE